jgi:hypothetical protein
MKIAVLGAGNLLPKGSASIAPLCLRGENSRVSPMGVNCERRNRTSKSENRGKLTDHTRCLRG